MNDNEGMIIGGNQNVRVVVETERKEEEEREKRKRIKHSETHTKKVKTFGEHNAKIGSLTRDLTEPSQSP